MASKILTGICVLGALCAVLAALRGYFVEDIWAVLDADVEYEIIVTDASTGTAIPDAKIDILIAGHDDTVVDVTLITGADGKACYLNKDNFCEEHVRGGRQISKSFARSWCGKLTIAARGYEGYVGSFTELEYLRVGWSKEKKCDHLRFSVPLEKAATPISVRPQ
jgi:hypothetical protein